MRSKILALMMLTAIIVTVLAPAVVHAQELNSSTARLCNGLPYLCEKRFDQVTFPGNHNSGSGADGRLRCCIPGTDAGPLDQCWQRNQGKSITQQLEFGIRYFDIDTCICKNILVTCHKECHGINVGKTTGPAIVDMLDEFDEFLDPKDDLDKMKKNRNEVIVLTFGNQSGNVQSLLYNHLLRWAPTPQRLENRELTIFKWDPTKPWPTLGDLVDTNQRIVVFVRNPDPLIGFEDIGVLSEPDHIFDTYTSDLSTCDFGNCSKVISNTRDGCDKAGHEEHSDKLVLISNFCGYGLCLSELACECNMNLLTSLEVCKEELNKETSYDRIPNFIAADWTQNALNCKPPYHVRHLVKRNIVQIVKYFNQKILKEEYSEEENTPLDISKDTATHIGFESNRNGKMISAGIEFNTQWLTDNELWKYEKYVWDQPVDLEYLKYGESICLRSKSNGKYLRAWFDTFHDGLYQSDWCRGDEEWSIERYDPENDHPIGTQGRVQAGDEICLYSMQHDRYVRAYNDRLGLQVHCETDEKFYVHAGWNDSDEDRVIDEGDNCPETYNPEQKDTDEDGKGDACDTDPVADANGPYVSECTSPAGADVQLDGSGSYDPDGELIAYDWLVSGQTASGVTPTLPLALGMHDVNLVVQDDQGYTDSDQTTATVQDTIVPTIESVIAIPNVLWPPNHKMVPITVGVSASDSCDSAPFCRIVSVESSEPGGKNAPDWQILGDLTINLRSERDGSGSGRVYTITVECTDKYGNSLSETAMVTVPHDQGKKKK